jgi:hypothetical protein
MGTGCESVKRASTADDRIEVTGTWAGGRIGIFREDPKSYGGKAKGENGECPVGAYDGYHPLVDEVVKFFQTKVVLFRPRKLLSCLCSWKRPTKATPRWRCGDISTCSSRRSTRVSRVFT